MFLQVMKDLRSNAVADLSKEDIVNAVKAKLTSSDNLNDDTVVKNV